MFNLTFDTSDGQLLITHMGHGSLILEFRSKVIHVDPYTEVTDYSEAPEADQIWITHDHFDHLDLKAIEQLKKSSTRFVADPTSAKKLYGPVIVLRNGDKRVVDGIGLEAVPAYNVIRERSPGIKYHPRGIGNGYVATFGDFRVYIAGDTEATPEMSQLDGIDLAFLPVLLPYTMSPEEVVQAVQAFSPEVVVPYHTDEKTAKEVAALLRESDVRTRVALP